MANISPVIQIDIVAPGSTPELITLGASCSEQELEEYKKLFREFCDVFAWSYTEMPSLDPAIIEHHIDTWPDVRPIRQKEHPIHPSKLPAVKAKIEKLRTVGFIYPIAYTT